MGASPTKTYKMPKGSGLTKPLALSSELADLVGAKKGEQLSRPEVVKRIWAYLKVNKLQDPENKQYFKPDAKMKPIFGEDKVRAFGMAKFLKSLWVKGSFSQEYGLLFWCNTELVVEGVMPDFFHIIPVGDDSVFNWVLQGKDSSLGLG